MDWIVYYAIRLFTLVTYNHMAPGLQEAAAEAFDENLVQYSPSGGYCRLSLEKTPVASLIENKYNQLKVTVVNNQFNLGLYSVEKFSDSLTASLGGRIS